MIFDSFLPCTFCSAIRYGSVNYNYMPKTVATWGEQRSNFPFEFDEEKEKYV